MTEKSYQERENELLRASMFADIREDIQFMGLSVSDIGWVIGVTFLMGTTVFLLPISFIIKLLWLITVFVTILMSRILKWSYRFRRLTHYIKHPKEGSGDSMDSLLGVTEDGWFYRSGKTIHIMLNVQSPPWETAVFSQKKQRIGGFETFLRSLVREGFECDITEEQIPDFRHEIWNVKKEKRSVSEGIERRKVKRLQLFEELAKSGSAKRSEYTIRLSISEFDLTIRQREDEPKGLSKAELKRHRLIAELRQRKDRVLNGLIQSGHECTIISGFSIPELTSRHWDRTVWEEWKASQGTWEEEEEEEETNDEPSNSQKSLIESVVLAIEGQREDAVIPTNDIDLRKNEDDFIFQPEHGEDPEILSVNNEAAVTMEDNAVGENNESKADSVKSEDIVVPVTNLTIMIRIIKYLDFIKNKLLDLKDLHFPKLKKLIYMFPKKSSKVESTIEIEEEEIVVENEKITKELVGVNIFTSPTSSGKSFVAANIAVANSDNERTVSLIDLSPHFGTLTLINPLQIDGEYAKWKSWSSRQVSGLSIFTPLEFPEIEEVQNLINSRLRVGAVVIDLPWNYPGRSYLTNQYDTIAIIDTDYHHWMRWETEVSNWKGEVWLNQVDVDMDLKMSALVKEHFKKEIDKKIPFFQNANQMLFQGRPLAIDPQARPFFVHSERSVEE
ncbi:hypothetical protein NST41_33765 [Paenibacillus sp. FSL L8-0696]|uniref:hypothetical protein n=1 Tax=Paenibacillus sp. FSL L8-0696 TaxID=2954524 RepID=UPI00311926AF